MGRRKKTKQNTDGTPRINQTLALKRLIFSTVRWKTVYKCKMGHCTLLHFYYTRISYKVTFWLFPPCSSHNSTCLTFPSSPGPVQNRSHFVGERPPCRISPTHSREVFCRGTHRKFQTLTDRKRLITSGLDHSRTTQGRTEKALPERERIPNPFTSPSLSGTKTHWVTEETLPSGSEWALWEKLQRLKGEHPSSWREQWASWRGEITCRELRLMKKKRETKKRQKVMTSNNHNLSCTEAIDRQKFYEVPVPDPHPYFFLGSQPGVQMANHIWHSADSSTYLTWEWLAQAQISL